MMSRWMERALQAVVATVFVAMMCFVVLSECGPGNAAQNACGLIGHKWGPPQHGVLLNMNGGPSKPMDLRFCARCGVSCDADWNAAGCRP